MSGTLQPERRPRLNPFAFPADTAFRVGLLVVAVVGANLYVWQWISIASQNAAEQRAGALECIALPFGEYSACVSELYRYQVAWMLGGTAALLLVTAALMVAMPLWITRRRRLRPLQAEDAPAAVAEVHELAREQGLREPRLYWNPLDQSSGGLAFGHPGRYSIAVGGGLIVQQVADPPAFRAVVRHELAHIRNRDVGITYFTLAIWYAFLLVSIVPFALTLLDEGAETVWSLLWRLAFLAALVFLTRNAVLRSREIYADLRASEADGPDGALRRVLAALPRPAPGRLGTLRRVHPDPGERLAAVDDTRTLFPLGAVVAFTAGLSSTIAYESVVQLLSTYFADALDLRFTAALAFAPLAIGVVGVAVWREAFAALADGREPASPWVDGLALAAGLLIGPELALEQSIVSEDTLFRTLGSFDGLLWAGILAGGIVLLLAWIRTSAAWWLQALGGRRSYAAGIVGLLVAAAALTAFMGVFYGVRSTSDALAFSRSLSEEQHAAVDAQVWTVPLQVWQFVMDSELLVIVYKPYFVPVLAALCLFPFAALLVRRRPDEAPWAFLDPGGELKTSRLSLHPLQPLAIGAAAGLVCLGLLALLRLGVHYGASAETRATDTAVLSFYVTTVTVALLVQLAAGAAGAWRGGLVGALGAAFVAGSFGWLGIVGGPMAGGCVDALSLNSGPCAWTVPASFSWSVFKQVIAEGAVAGLAGGLAVVGVRALVRRRRPAEELQPAGVAP
jgi:Zn-dependent protease with chaperone function